MQNTPNLTSALPAIIRCPTGHFSGVIALNANCRAISYPLIENDLFWQNRAFNIQVGGMGSGNLSQQNLVSLVPSLNQATTGQCVASGSNTSGPTAVTYWDIGVRGDTGPSNHSLGKLSPSYSVLTSLNDYTDPTLKSGDPMVISQYCNGSRVPPENGGMGYQVPPGIADATIPNPVFNLTPAATVDEGNNWINMTYGPLAVSNPTLLPEVSPAAPVAPASAPNVSNYGNYGLTGMSTNSIGTANLTAAPTTDFFGVHRTGRADIGAVEYAGTVATTSSATLTPTTWPISHARNCPGTTIAQRLACALDPVQTFTLTNTGTATLTGITTGALGGDSGDFALRPALSTCGTGAFTTLAPGKTCVITVQYQPRTSDTANSVHNATLSVTDSAGTQSSTLVGTAQ
jgi:hypothetical protein